MNVIMDANVLFRTLISSGNILEVIFHQHLTIYAPRKLKDEFLSHQHEIRIKSHLSQQSLNLLIEEVFKRIIFIESESYKPFLTKAQNLLHHHHKDQDFIALCLLMDCKCWTYEKRIFDIGFGISTKEIMNRLINEGKR